MSVTRERFLQEIVERWAREWTTSVAVCEESAISSTIRYLRSIHEHVDSCVARQRRAEEWLEQAEQELVSFTSCIMSESCD